MPVTRCMPRKHRGSLTLFVEARVFVVLRGAGTTPARPPLPAATAGWHWTGGLVEADVMGDVSGGGC